MHEKGLDSEEVSKRHKKFGLNSIRKSSFNPLQIFLRQFTSNPLIIVLAFTTLLTFFVGDKISAYYIFAIILASIILGFWNEFFAERSIEKLLKRVALSAIVIRNGEKIDIPVFQITIGDIVLLTPGSVVPADLKLISTTNLEIDESALTGESAVVFKNDKSSSAFMGTTVSAGSGMGIVSAIGKETEYGKIAKESIYLKPETVFQKGLAKYGALLVWVMSITAISSLGANLILGRGLLESLLFSLAIAVGLTPELLPVIVTISLAHGAGKLAKKEVLVKQLISIENLGNIDILCTDKTGTLTEGKITVSNYLNVKGVKDEEILKLGLICNNAIVHHKIIGTPYDSALWEYVQVSQPKLIIKTTKVFEEPFDFSKRLMFTVIEEKKIRTLIVKGAPEAIFELSGNHKSQKDRYKNLSSDGLNVVALATKTILKKEKYDWGDLKDLDFAGFICFSDPPKKSAKKAIEALQKLNVQIKILTGDNEVVAGEICKEIGLDIGEIIQGDYLNTLEDDDLCKLISETVVFARVAPLQKLKIIKTLQKMGHTVGYLGDGINDVPALRNADVGLSVNSTVDVAKDSAQVVLLRKDLNTITDGIMEGRKAFSNTIKYILTYTGSNFGEMVSLASASFFMPFLPITPSQLLLQDALYDVSQMTISSDNVDPETMIKPKHWDLGFIKNYMIFFGVLSTLAIAVTFWFLISILKAPPHIFRTGIFLEFLISEMIVVFIIRTNRVPFYKSRPSLTLILACLFVLIIGFYLPYSPLADSLGFAPLPALFFIFLAILCLIYTITTEVGKKFLLKKLNV